MRKLLFRLYCLLMLLVMPTLAFAQNDKAPVVRTEAKSGPVGAVIKDLATTWWLWAGIIVILGLLGLLFYLRNKTDD